MNRNNLKIYIEKAIAIEKQIKAKLYDEAIASCNALRSDMQPDSDKFMKEQDHLDEAEGLYYAAVYNALATINSVVISGNNLSPLLMALREAEGEMTVISEMLENFSE